MLSSMLVLLWWLLFFMRHVNDYFDADIMRCHTMLGT